MKVLIAENAQDAHEICGILSGEGYECVFVEKSGEFIDRVYTELPNLIILGIRLSHPSGLDILKKLKSAPSTWNIPVILSAANRCTKTLAKGYELGAFDYISKPYFKEEILARVRNITYTNSRVEELEQLLDRDYLTGLYNRRFFMERFVEELAWSARYQEPLSVLMLDIDHFKKINDTYGHGCGDEVLKQVAKTLTSALRTEDIVARYGGEEFIILLSNTGSDGAATSGEKLRAAVRQTAFCCDDIRLTVTISVGVTVSDGSVESSTDTIIGQADNALYAAKEGGRNRVVLYAGANQ
jgi:two-component system cell cycle response regulator